MSGEDGPHLLKYRCRVCGLVTRDPLMMYQYDKNLCMECMHAGNFEEPPQMESEEELAGDRSRTTLIMLLALAAVIVIFLMTSCARRVEYDIETRSPAKRCYVAAGDNPCEYCPQVICAEKLEVKSWQETEENPPGKWERLKNLLRKQRD